MCDVIKYLMMTLTEPGCSSREKTFVLDLLSHTESDDFNLRTTIL